MMRGNIIHIRAMFRNLAKLWTLPFICHFTHVTEWLEYAVASCW